MDDGVTFVVSVPFGLTHVLYPHSRKGFAILFICYV